MSKRRFLRKIEDTEFTNTDGEASASFEYINDHPEDGIKEGDIVQRSEDDLGTLNQDDAPDTENLRIEPRFDTEEGDDEPRDFSNDEYTRRQTLRDNNKEE